MKTPIDSVTSMARIASKPPTGLAKYSIKRRVKIKEIPTAKNKAIME